MTWQLSADSNITFPTRAKGRLYIKENKSALLEKYGDWPRLVPTPKDDTPEGGMPIREVIEILDDLYKIVGPHSAISLYKSAILGNERG